MLPRFVRSRLSRAAAVLAVAALTGCAGRPASPATSGSALPDSSASAATAPAPRTANEPYRAPERIGGTQLPWSDVGPGWFLVVEDTSTFSATHIVTSGATRLWLVAPTGSKYLVMQWAANASPGGGLAAWAADGREALLVSNATATGTVTELNLVTGAATSFAVENLLTADYAGSAGGGILGWSDPPDDPHGTGGVLVLFDSAGQQRSVLIRDGSTLAEPPPGWLPARDGSSIYLTGNGGLQVVPGTGGVERQLDAITGSAYLCSPVRWWDVHTVLAACNEPPATRLWLVPDDGTTPTALTASVVPDATSAPDWGSYDAVRTAGGQVYTQRPGACGGGLVGALGAGGRVQTVAIPGSLGSDWLVGATGDAIAVRSSANEGDCYGSGWFGFYDGRHDKTTKIVTDPPDELGAVEALAFGPR